jgi:hypothetical protein
MISLTAGVCGFQRAGTTTITFFREFGGAQRQERRDGSMTSCLGTEALGSAGGCGQYGRGA